jgi:hypothetical protein
MAVMTVFLTDVEYPVTLRREVYQLADLANEGLVIGSIVTRLHDGCIYFRNTFDARDIHPSPEAVTRFLSVSAFALALWEKAYNKLLNHRGEPIDCLNAALIELDANDSSLVSAATRRAILKVNQGASQSAIISVELNEIIPHLKLV